LMSSGQIDVGSPRSPRKPSNEARREGLKAQNALAWQGGTQIEKGKNKELMKRYSEERINVKTPKTFLMPLPSTSFFPILFLLLAHD